MNSAKDSVMRLDIEFELAIVNNFISLMVEKEKRVEQTNMGKVRGVNRAE